MNKVKQHIDFLKTVFIHSCTSFGGAQGHFAMVIKTFVEKKKIISKKELLRLQGMCTMIPGGTTTQVLILLGYKQGGVWIALLTLLLWVTPASILMGGLSYLYFSNNYNNNLIHSFFIFIQPMAIGFIVFAFARMWKNSIKNTITKYILVIGSIITFFCFKTPWIFPIMFIVTGAITNISKKRIPNRKNLHPIKIPWLRLFIFLFIFLSAGILSEQATVNHWRYQKPINLFENMYRFGSMVFGGGEVLMPMMYEQYVVRPQTPKIIKNKREVLQTNRSVFFRGYGLVRGMPGPAFSICSYMGGSLLSTPSALYPQWWGCLIGTIGIFLPSFLLIIFFYPIMTYLSSYPIILRAIEGINATVISIIGGAILYLLKDLIIAESIDNIIWIYISTGVIALTFILLYYTKISSPLIVLIAFVLGLIKYLFC